MQIELPEADFFFTEGGGGGGVRARLRVGGGGGAQTGEGPKRPRSLFAGTHS